VTALEIFYENIKFKTVTNSISGVTEKVDGNPYHVLISKDSERGDKISI